MACEDFPCCGHEPGCCPDFDENGRQLNMRCICGAVLPINAPSSICDSCLRDMDDAYDSYDAELAQDQILERQELEDFEGIVEDYGDFYGDE